MAIDLLPNWRARGNPAASSRQLASSPSVAFFLDEQPSENPRAYALKSNCFI